jgi:hypothetical protein
MLDLSKRYLTPNSKLEVELFALRDDYYYGRYKSSFNGVWTPARWSVETVKEFTEVKPKHTKTYWLAHYRQGGTVVVSDLEKAGWTICNYIAAITGPYTVTFEEGQDDRTK